MSNDGKKDDSFKRRSCRRDGTSQARCGETTTARTAAPSAHATRNKAGASLEPLAQEKTDLDERSALDDLDQPVRDPQFGGNLTLRHARLQRAQSVDRSGLQALRAEGVTLSARQPVARRLRKASASGVVTSVPCPVTTICATVCALALSQPAQFFSAHSMS